MTKAEKAGYEAYPENKGYSTISDVMYDYNAEKRRVFIEGYEQGCIDTIDHPNGGELIYVLNKGVKQGYKDAANKVWEFLIERYENQGVILLDDINELKQILEEQQQ